MMTDKPVGLGDCAILRGPIPHRELGIIQGSTTHRIGIRRAGMLQRTAPNKLSPTLPCPKAQ